MILICSFGTYHIRGVLGETLDAEATCSNGYAFDREAWAPGGDAVVIGVDGALSGPQALQTLGGRGKTLTVR